MLSASAASRVSSETPMWGKVRETGSGSMSALPFVIGNGV
jgi:hypothetical protein